jgi:hypothetical protein
MNRRRYEGYLGLQNAVARQGLAEHPAAILGDLAEGLLLARDESEARQAAARVPDGLGSLVSSGDLSRFAAHRFWALFPRCGPQVSWPASWDQPSRTYGRPSTHRR